MSELSHVDESGDVHMVDERGRPGLQNRVAAQPLQRERGLRLAADLGQRLAEQAQVDGGGRLGEQGEVGALAVPGRAERERCAGPGAGWCRHFHDILTHPGGVAARNGKRSYC